MSLWLHCGHCCLNLSPFSSEEKACPSLKNDGNMYFCGQHRTKPECCGNHDFPLTGVCPVGKELLGLKTFEEIKSRIEEIRRNALYVSDNFSQSIKEIK